MPPATRVPVPARILTILRTPDGVLGPGHLMRFANENNAVTSRAEVFLLPGHNVLHLVLGAIRSFFVMHTTHRRPDIKRADRTRVFIRSAHQCRISRPLGTSGAKPLTRGRRACILSPPVTPYPPTKRRLGGLLGAHRRRHAPILGRASVKPSSRRRQVIPRP